MYFEGLQKKKKRGNQCIFGLSSYYQRHAASSLLISQPVRVVTSRSLLHPLFHPSCPSQSSPIFVGGKELSKNRSLCILFSIPFSLGGFKEELVKGFYILPLDLGPCIFFLHFLTTALKSVTNDFKKSLDTELGSVISPVGQSNRIHRQNHCRGLRPPTCYDCPGYNTKPADGEDPVQKHWELLPGLL